MRRAPRPHPRRAWRSLCRSCLPCRRTAANLQKATLSGLCVGGAAHLKSRVACKEQQVISWQCQAGSAGRQCWQAASCWHHEADAAWHILTFPKQQGVPASHARQQAQAGRSRPQLDLRAADQRARAGAVVRLGYIQPADFEQLDVKSCGSCPLPGGSGGPGDLRHCQYCSDLRVQL